MTSIKWLKTKLETHGTRDVCVIGWEELDSLIEQAKELRKKEMIKFTNDYLDDDEDLTAEQYYNTIFENKENQKQLILEIMEEDSKDGLYDTSLQECVNCNEQKQVHSMCLDCCIKLGNQNQTEISDEEIKKAAHEHGYEHHSFFTAATSNQKKLSWIAACKWYREQLKQIK